MTIIPDNISIFDSLNTNKSLRKKVQILYILVNSLELNLLFKSFFKIALSNIPFINPLKLALKICSLLLKV